jgi:hypothetical protein
VTPAPLLVALLLAAPAGPSPRQPTAGPTAPGQRVERVVRFPPWQFSGTFSLEGAGLTDRGQASDAGSLAGADAAVERVLTGELGTLRLSLRGEVHGASFPRLFGRWQVTGGTGAYAGLTGGGTFTATDLGQAQGSPLELQTLVGRVLPARRPAWRDPGAPPPAVLRPVGPTPQR